MRYLKKLGQNFLVNKKALKKITETLEIKKGETIIEIGAGTGNLTGEILKKTGKLIAIEKDKNLVKSLKLKFKNHPNLKIIEGDVREVLPEIAKKLKNYIRSADVISLGRKPKIKISGFPPRLNYIRFTDVISLGENDKTDVFSFSPRFNYKIVGNIPYYLTGRLLRIFQELKNPPKLIVLTLQKEVAERIAAQAPKMNKLSAIINLWAKPKILFHLKPADFYPAPKVSSSVIKLEVLPLKKRLKNEELIIQLIKIGSHQPRKTLLNNLSRIFPKNNLKNAFYELNLGDKTRPDDLNRDLWIKLAKILS